MSYEVIARKWRPQTFNDVVGQDHVVRTMRNAIEQNRIAQAYLLCGPRGTGKTTLARIFAKALNCVNGPTISPCCECSNCKEIANGTSMDVTEIDGASNNKVEDVHQTILDNVNFAPVSGKFKIFYIDEVHMLSASAFNALLKTIEEPPPHVRFIFATTEADKVLGTIVSRCQRFDLRRISISEISGQLKKICTAENITIDDDALLALARGADGGMRDAQSALDQLISFTGNSITEKDVIGVFGLVSRETIENLAEAILVGNIPSIIKFVAELDNGGKDLRRLTSELITHFRNILVCIQFKGNTATLDLTDSQCETLKKHSSITNTTAVLNIIENLIELDSKLRFSLTPRTILETAFIRCAHASSVTDLEKILKKLTVMKTELDSMDNSPDVEKKNNFSSTQQYDFNKPISVKEQSIEPPSSPISQPLPKVANVVSNIVEKVENRPTIQEQPNTKEIKTNSPEENDEKLLRSYDEIKKDPFVKDVLSIFNGTINTIKSPRKNKV